MTAARSLLTTAARFAERRAVAPALSAALARPGPLNLVPSKLPFTAASRALTTGATPANGPTTDRRYFWIEVEAQRLVAQAYQLHQPDRPFPPSRGLDRSELEQLRTVPHYAPRTFADRVALVSTSVLEKFMSLFFRKEYVHHAVTLEVRPSLRPRPPAQTH